MLNNNNNLYKIYNKWFKVIEVKTSEQLKEVYHLRYKVYCIECGFENAIPNHPFLELDEYDSNSVHCALIFKPTNEFVGTARVILPNIKDPNNSFPLQKLCKDPDIKNKNIFPINKMGEFSRFCISSKFDEYLENLKYEYKIGRNNYHISKFEKKIILSNLSIGLIKGLFELNIKNNLTHMCAEMEPFLIKILLNLGIHFKFLGPTIKYHGIRQPCMNDLITMFNDIKKYRPDVYKYVTNKGALSDKLKKLINSNKKYEKI